KGIVCNGEDVFGIEPVGAKSPVLHTPAKADAIDAFGSQELPRTRLIKPRIRLLDLPAVDNLLAEHAVSVPDAVTDTRQSQRCRGIQEACCKTAETAVAEGGTDLECQH